jgi:pimeloyl-[acyl-carrier protein] methyl ester esterase
MNAGTDIKHWLFLRGLSREQAHWGEFIKRCESELGWYCHAIDQPGFGSEHLRRSPLTISEIRRDIQRRLPSELANDNSTFGIVALSLGGMVALDWLTTSPNNIAKVIFISTSSADCGFFKRLKPSALPATLYALFALSPRKQERAILNVVSNNKSSHAALLEQWCQIRARHPASKRNVIRQLIAASRFYSPSKERLANSRGHFISSRADRMVSYQCSEYLAEKYHWPLWLHNTAGHDLPIDDADYLLASFKEIASCAE